MAHLIDKSKLLEGLMNGWKKRVENGFQTEILKQSVFTATKRI